MQWTYVRDGHRRACSLRRVDVEVLLEISYECATSPILVQFDEPGVPACAQVALERDWISNGWSLAAFSPD